MTASAHPGWRQTRPDALTRELRLRDFDAAIDADRPTRSWT